MNNINQFLCTRDVVIIFDWCDFGCLLRFRFFVNVSDECSGEERGPGDNTNPDPAVSVQPKSYDNILKLKVDDLETPIFVKLLSSIFY